MKAKLSDVSTPRKSFPMKDKNKGMGEEIPGIAKWKETKKKKNPEKIKRKARKQKDKINIR